MSLWMNSSGGILSFLGLRLSRAQTNAVAIKAPSMAHPIAIPAALAFESPFELVGGEVDVGQRLDIEGVVAIWLLLLDRVADAVG